MKDYFKELFLPWKLATGFVAILTILIVGRYAGDPTWDDGLSILMGGLTFLTSSYFVSTLRDFKRTTIWKKILAVVLLLISAVWSYDYYNYFRDGFIPPSANENILVSVPLYIISGFFWTLDLKQKYSIIVAAVCILFFASCFGFYYFYA